MTRMVRTLLVFAVVVSESLISCIPVSKDTTPTTHKPASEIELVAVQQKKIKSCEYLRRFGYGCNQTSANEVDDASLNEGLIRFQQFNGLNVSGEMDSETDELMGHARCGVPDMDGEPVGKTRRKRFVTTGSFWPTFKSKLTYRIGSSPTSRISSALVAERIREAYAAWMSHVPPSRISVKEAFGSQVPDIKIDFRSGNHGDRSSFDGSGGTLAHAFFPTDGRVHFDDDETWIDTPDDQRRYNGFYFYQVALHEFGHDLGLAHSQDRNAVMAPYYYYDPDYHLTDDDIRGIQALYGVYVSPCANNPCQNGGSCSTDESGYLCRCPNGWADKNCSTRVQDVCENNPCINGGSCRSSGSLYFCTCLSQWTGDNCNIPYVDPCGTNPCQNGGMCRVVEGSYVCNCMNDWTGRNCTRQTGQGGPFWRWIL